LHTERVTEAEKTAFSQKSPSKKAKRKKSFVATIFSRSGGRSDYSPGLSTITSDQV